MSSVSARIRRLATTLVGASTLLLAVAGVAPAGAGAEVPSTGALTYGTDGTVDALTKLGSTVYLGGTFSNVGLATGGGAGLSSTSGAANPGMPAVSGSGATVYAAAPDGSGGFYIGGDFTHVGGLPRSNIAHIRANGTVDPNFNPNANGAVYALALYGTTLYAGGNFSGTGSIGGQDRNHIAALNTSDGTATGWNPNAGNDVRALALSGDGQTVYAGGNFQGTGSIGGQDRNYIAALNASDGLATSWNPNANSSVFALAVDGSTVYVGGDFSGASSIGGQNRNYIAAINASGGNATSWNPNANSDIYALAVSGDGQTVYAGGGFNGASSIGGQNRNYIAALNASDGTATSWNPNANSYVYALALSGTTLYVGGDFNGTNSIGGADRNYIAALSVSTGAATGWNPNASSFDVFALALSGQTVYAGGAFSLINQVPRDNLAAISTLTGRPTSWNPGANGDVFALAANGSTVYAGGGFTMAGGQTRNRLAGFDATTGALTGFDPDATNTIRALAVSDDGNTVYAGGFFIGTNSIGGQDRNYIAALNASDGTATTWNPNANNVVWALAVDGPTVYAGGDFNGANSIGTAARNRIAALDAATGAATPWDPNANGRVRAIVPSGALVYVGGEGFGNIGGQGRNNLAALNVSDGTATSWNPSPNGSVYALALNGPTVYVGGDFHGSGSIGGADRDKLAAVDTTTGTATSFDPGGVGGDGYALVATLTSLYAGGGFSQLKNGPGAYFAAFVPNPANVAVPTITGTPVAGKTLLCNKGTWTGAMPQSYAYQWLRNGIAITGATGSTYLVKSTDAGKTIKCRVTASNDGKQASAVSAGVVIKTPPKNTAAPTISGTPKVGKTLTCNKGTWTGSTPITYKYQWLRNGSPIAGATSASYVVKSADLNRFLSCRVTATNVAGTASKTSAAVKVT